MNIKLQKILISVLLLTVLIFCLPVKAVKAVDLEQPHDIQFSIDASTGHVSCQFTALSDFYIIGRLFKLAGKCII